MLAIASFTQCARTRGAGAPVPGEGMPVTPSAPLRHPGAARRARSDGAERYEWKLNYGDGDSNDCGETDRERLMSGSLAGIAIPRAPVRRRDLPTGCLCRSGRGPIHRHPDHRCARPARRGSAGFFAESLDAPQRPPSSRATRPPLVAAPRCCSAPGCLASDCRAASATSPPISPSTLPCAPVGTRPVRRHRSFSRFAISWIRCR